MRYKKMDEQRSSLEQIPNHLFSFISTHAILKNTADSSKEPQFN